ncbi:hypothetical protein ACOJBO_03925 [Rhizobium beringeri]
MTTTALLPLARLNAVAAPVFRAAEDIPALVLGSAFSFHRHLRRAVEARPR